MSENEKNNVVRVIVELCKDNASLPTKGSSQAACFDVYSAEDQVIIPGFVTVVSTGIKMKIPEGYMIHIVPRSGLAFKNGVTVLGGIIDSDYRGEVKVMLSTIIKEPIITTTSGVIGLKTYDSSKRLKIKAGDRIAQLQVIAVPTVVMTAGKVDDDTSRGAGGFGSTGK